MASQNKITAYSSTTAPTCSINCSEYSFNYGCEFFKQVRHAANSLTEKKESVLENDIPTFVLAGEISSLKNYINEAETNPKKFARAVACMVHEISLPIPRLNCMNEIVKQINMIFDQSYLSVLTNDTAALTSGKQFHAVLSVLRDTMDVIAQQRGLRTIWDTGSILNWYKLRNTVTLFFKLLTAAGDTRDGRLFAPLELSGPVVRIVENGGAELSVKQIKQSLNEHFSRTVNIYGMHKNKLIDCLVSLGSQNLPFVFALAVTKIPVTNTAQKIIGYKLRPADSKAEKAGYFFTFGMHEDLGFYVEAKERLLINFLFGRVSHCFKEVLMEESLLDAKEKATSRLSKMCLGRGIFYATANEIEGLRLSDFLEKLKISIKEETEAAA
jgi:hypothetical protein